MVISAASTSSNAAIGPARPVALPPLRHWLARLFRRRVRACPPLAGVAARINEQVLAVTSVNGAGFSVLGYRGLLNPQDRFSFTLTLDGLDIAGDAVVAWRRDGRRDGGMGIAFYGLSAAERGRLAQWLTGRDG
ncbi:PilZ domain-containing protein [Niveispirillum fermenti]|uniref:PilZ domain-containing protein n=1 Tax=Niveispirillum fermenti TaxID=1233113 RepID=UPI003A8B644E